MSGTAGRAEGTWVFGYGSLASPDSFGNTIGRVVDPHVDVVVARLTGFGRRWNYGSLHLRGDWRHDGVMVRRGLVVSLGLTAAVDESCNGIAVRVSDDELALLDHRERDYERTDVTDAIATTVTGARAEPERPAGRVVTYVPRPSAVERYEQARDEGRAAVRRSYWELVHDAFGLLGADHLELLGRTPPPDVPVVDIVLAPHD